MQIGSFLGCFFLLCLSALPVLGQSNRQVLLYHSCAAMHQTIAAKTPPCKQNLLKNPSLEKGLEAWYGGGELAHSQDEDQAIKSCHTYEAAFQTVEAMPGEVYTLRVFAKKERESSGAIAIKFLNKDFLPLQQNFLPIETENYNLIQYSAAAPARAVYLEVNIFQDGGSGCVFADNWCLAKGGKAMATCKNTKKLAKMYENSAKKIVVKEEIQEDDRYNQRLQVLQALLLHPEVTQFWKEKTSQNLQNQSLAYRFVHQYIFDSCP